MTNEDVRVKSMNMRSGETALVIGGTGPTGPHVVNGLVDRGFKTAMLQDAEAGRELELDAIVTAVHEIGRRLGVETPMIDAILGLARLFGRVRGIYPAAG